MRLTAARRRAIYAATCVLTPVVIYLKARGYIGDLELTLWGAEVSAVTVLAGIKTTDVSPPTGVYGEQIAEQRRLVQAADKQAQAIAREVREILNETARSSRRKPDAR